MKDILEAGMSELSSQKHAFSEIERHNPSTAPSDPAARKDVLCSLVRDLASQYISAGMTKLANREVPFVLKNRSGHLKFVESFVNDLFVRGLKSSVERINDRPVDNAGDTIFMTSR